MGWFVICTFSKTDKEAELETNGQVAPFKSTSKKLPFREILGFVIVKVAVLTPLKIDVLVKFTPFCLH